MAVNAEDGKVRGVLARGIADVTMTPVTSADAVSAINNLFIDPWA